MKLILASQNANKLREFRAMFAPLGVTLLSQSDAGLSLDVEETGSTFEANARLKAEAVLRATGIAAIADDSGLAVDSLGGAPGVYSHRYGNQPDDAARCRYLLEQMRDIPEELRTAKFVSAIVSLFPDGQEITARGECSGIILREMRGENGFGYDPVFFFPEYGKTFAELTMTEKNEISHRGRALRAFYTQLEERLKNDDQ